MNSLKALREENHITQKQPARLCGVSLRTYQRYESDPGRENSLIYEAIENRLNEEYLLDEEHGLLTIEQIQSICREIFDPYEIRYCYLFGSYAKGKANEISDVDLLYSGNVKGIKHFVLCEELKEALHKVVDLLDDRQIRNNLTLVNEILADGIHIYRRPEFSAGPAKTEKDK